MIDRVMAFKTSDGLLFVKLEDMQVHEMAIILSGLSGEPAPAKGSGDVSIATSAVQRFAAAKAQAHDILKFKDRIIDVLTMSANAKPKARAINGGTKNRASRTRPAVTPPQDPGPNSATALH